MEPSFYSILPALVVLVLGFATRSIFISLLCGIGLAGVIAKSSLIDGIVFAGSRVIHSSQVDRIFTEGFFHTWNPMICAFLFILGIFISILHRSGSARAYEYFIKAKLKSKKQAESASMLMSTGLFVDDYFSTLTTGTVMRGVTDAFKVPRAKLAFLVDTMAAPLTVICPISSWVAAIVGFLRDNGFAAHETEQTRVLVAPYIAYLHVVPYVLYSLIAVFGTWFIVLTSLSFGKMAFHEKLAAEGNLYGKGAPRTKADHVILGDKRHKEGGIFDFVLMIIFLTIAILGCLAYSGYKPGSTLVDAFRNSSAAHGLFAGGVMILSFELLWFLGRGLISIKEIPGLFVSGVKLMGPSVLVLIAAWALGDILRNNLHTGQYLAELLTEEVPLVWFPAMFFVAAGVTSICIGSSWGTAAIMFPIAIQMFFSTTGIPLPASYEDVRFLFVILGATLSGAVAGDHVSPISDTTIMSSTSSGVVHADHVDTQLHYAIPMMMMAGFSFVLIGLLWPLGEGIALLSTYAFSVVGISTVLWGLHLLHKRMAGPFMENFKN